MGRKKTSLPRRHIVCPSCNVVAKIKKLQSQSKDAIYECQVCGTIVVKKEGEFKVW